jgi:hypothetical protein
VWDLCLLVGHHQVLQQVPLLLLLLLLLVAVRTDPAPWALPHQAAAAAAGVWMHGQLCPGCCCFHLHHQQPSAELEPCGSEGLQLLYDLVLLLQHLLLLLLLLLRLARLQLLPQLDGACLLRLDCCCYHHQQQQQPWLLPPAAAALLGLRGLPQPACQPPAHAPGELPRMPGSLQVRGAPMLCLLLPACALLHP